MAALGFVNLLMLAHSRTARRPGGASANGLGESVMRSGPDVGTRLPTHEITLLSDDDLRLFSEGAHYRSAAVGQGLERAVSGHARAPRSRCRTRGLRVG
jgi:hypothetical protein